MPVTAQIERRSAVRWRDLSPSLAVMLRRPEEHSLSLPAKFWTAVGIAAMAIGVVGWTMLLLRLSSWIVSLV